jgi:hypothetical protein
VFYEHRSLWASWPIWWRGLNSGSRVDEVRGCARSSAARHIRICSIGHTRNLAPALRAIARPRAIVINAYVHFVIECLAAEQYDGYLGRHAVGYVVALDIYRRGERILLS